MFRLGKIGDRESGKMLDYALFEERERDTYDLKNFILRLRTWTNSKERMKMEQLTP